MPDDPNTLHDLIRTDREAEGVVRDDPLTSVAQLRARAVLERLSGTPAPPPAVETPPPPTNGFRPVADLAGRSPEDIRQTALRILGGPRHNAPQQSPIEAFSGDMPVPGVLPAMPDGIASPEQPVSFQEALGERPPEPLTPEMLDPPGLDPASAEERRRLAEPPMQELHRRISESSAALMALGDEGYKSAPDDAARLTRLNQFRASLDLEPLDELTIGRVGTFEQAKESFGTGEGLVAATPFVGVAYSFLKLQRLREAALAVQAGDAHYDDWRVLADYQDDLVEEARARNLGGDVVRISHQMLPFALEWKTGGALLQAIRGGSAAAAPMARVAAAAQRAKVEVAKQGLARAAPTVAEATTRAVVEGTKSLALGPMVPRWLEGTVQKYWLPDYLLRPGDEQSIEMLILAPPMPLWDAIIGAGVEIIIEGAGEAMGPMLGVFAFGGRQAAKTGLSKLAPQTVKVPAARIAEYSANLKARIAADLMRRYPNKFKTFRAATEFLAEFGYHGPIQEVGEEALQKLMRDAAGVLGVPGIEPEEWPSAQEATAMFIAFAIPGLAGGGVALAARDRRQRVERLTPDEQTAAPETTQAPAVGEGTRPPADRRPAGPTPPPVLPPSAQGGESYRIRQTPRGWEVYDVRTDEVLQPVTNERVGAEIAREYNAIEAESGRDLASEQVRRTDPLEELRARAYEMERAPPDDPAGATRSALTEASTALQEQGMSRENAAAQAAIAYQAGRRKAERERGAVTSALEPGEVREPRGTRSKKTPLQEAREAARAELAHQQQTRGSPQERLPQDLPPDPTTDVPGRRIRRTGTGELAVQFRGNLSPAFTHLIGEEGGGIWNPKTSEWRFPLFGSVRELEAFLGGGPNPARIQAQERSGERGTLQPADVRDPTPNEATRLLAIKDHKEFLTENFRASGYEITQGMRANFATAPDGSYRYRIQRGKVWRKDRDPRTGNFRDTPQEQRQPIKKFADSIRQRLRGIEAQAPPLRHVETGSPREVAQLRANIAARAAMLESGHTGTGELMTAEQRAVAEERLADERRRLLELTRGRPAKDQPRVGPEAPGVQVERVVEGIGKYAESRQATREEADQALRDRRAGQLKERKKPDAQTKAKTQAETKTAAEAEAVLKSKPEREKRLPPGKGRSRLQRLTDTTAGKKGDKKGVSREPGLYPDQIKQASQKAKNIYTAREAVEAGLRPAFRHVETGEVWIQPSEDGKYRGDPVHRIDTVPAEWHRLDEKGKLDHVDPAIEYGWVDESGAWVDYAEAGGPIAMDQDAAKLIDKAGLTETKFDAENMDHLQALAEWLHHDALVVEEGGTGFDFAQEGISSAAIKRRDDAWKRFAKAAGVKADTLPERGSDRYRAMKALRYQLAARLADQLVRDGTVTNRRVDPGRVVIDADTEKFLREQGMHHPFGYSAMANLPEHRKWSERLYDHIGDRLMALREKGPFYRSLIDGIGRGLMGGEWGLTERDRIHFRRPKGVKTYAEMIGRKTGKTFDQELGSFLRAVPRDVRAEYQELFDPDRRRTADDYVRLFELYEAAIGEAPPVSKEATALFERLRDAPEEVRAAEQMGREFLAALEEVYGRLGPDRDYPDPVAGQWSRVTRELIDGERTPEQVTPAQQRVLDVYAPLAEEISDYIISTPEMWDDLAAFGMPDIVTLIAMRRAGPGVYLRRLYHTLVEEPTAAMPHEPPIQVLRMGARIRGGQFLQRQSDVDWWYVVDKTGSRWKTLAFNSPEAAGAALNELRQKNRVKYGEQVEELFTVLDPFDTEELARKGLIEPVRDVPRLMVETLVTSWRNIRAWELFRYIKETSATSAFRTDFEARQHGFRMMPDVPELGPIRGMAIPEPMAWNLNETETVWHNWWTAFWNRYDIAFKATHTVWNPATHGRNHINSAWVFPWLSSVDKMEWIRQLPRAAKLFRDAHRDPTKMDQTVRDLIEDQYLQVQFAETEWREFARHTKDGEFLTEEVIDRWVMNHPRIRKLLKDGTRKLGQITEQAGRLYEMPENIMKLAEYLVWRKKGLSHDAALHLGNRHWPNYAVARRSTWYRMLRKAHGYGLPLSDKFIIFKMEALRIYAHAARSRPGALAALVGSMGLMTWATRALKGIGDAEMELIDSDYRRQGSWINRYFQPLMPVPCRWTGGKPVEWIDLRYTFPMASDLRAFNNQGGINVPLLFNSPEVNLFHELVSNRNRWTDRPIWEEDDKAFVMGLKAALHGYKQAAPVPPLVKRGIGEMVTAAMGEGRRSFPAAVLKEVAGVRIDSPHVTSRQALRVLREAVRTGQTTPEKADQARQMLVLWNTTFRDVARERPISRERFRRIIDEERERERERRLDVARGGPRTGRTRPRD